jgi:hypothetical protein
VLNTLATRSTFTDTRQFFIQFLQTTPDTGYIVDNLTRSLVDMADDDDIGSNPIIGPWLFDCGSGVNTCFAAVRPENMNILAINFYNHTEFGVNAMSQAEDAACVDGQGTCDLSAAEQQTISFAVPSCQQGAQPRLCTYLAPLTFDFIDQVVRFDEYARTAPVVNVTAPVAPASTGWYNAATLGGPGNALTVDVNVSDYRYPTGISALSCLDGAAAFAVAPSAPPTDSSEQATGALTDGVHQIACQGTDGADQGFNEQGNEGAGPGSQQSVSFQIDTHPPTVTFSGDSGSYGILANVAISCTAADTLSGVASTTCPTTSGPGWSFGAGPHVLNATATDKAGNVGSGSANFTITVTAADIDTLTHQFAHGAAQYKVLPAFMKAIADLVISANDLPLKAIGPKTTAAQKHALISAYDQGIQTLAKQGWLTTAQAATLVGLAAAL